TSSWFQGYVRCDRRLTDGYTLSLHDALPIFHRFRRGPGVLAVGHREGGHVNGDAAAHQGAGGLEQRPPPVDVGRIEDPRRDLRRSEEHTSELQSRENLVCRLLLEKKNERPSQ